MITSELAPIKEVYLISTDKLFYESIFIEQDVQLRLLIEDNKYGCIGEKNCGTCKTVKSKNDFHRNGSECKKCSSKRVSLFVKKKLKKDPVYRLMCNLRSYNYAAFKAIKEKKTYRTKRLLGVSQDELKMHIEKQFIKGMSWDNYGRWHVDHIMPLSSAKTKPELRKLFYYTNLQPLWGKDNISKSGKIPLFSRLD